VFFGYAPGEVDCCDSTWLSYSYNSLVLIFWQEKLREFYVNKNLLRLYAWIFRSRFRREGSPPDSFLLNLVMVRVLNESHRT
jgi:hypothetical protein